MNKISSSHEQVPVRSIFRRPLTAVVLALSLVSLPACSSDAKTCDLTVFAQNRWPGPSGGYGTAVRADHDLDSEKIASFAGNQRFEVDGWVATGEPVYPDNPSPWNSDIWLRTRNLIDGRKGWVSFAGVRAGETDQDPSRQAAYGGEQVSLDQGCKL